MHFVKGTLPVVGKRISQRVDHRVYPRQKVAHLVTDWSASSQGRGKILNQTWRDINLAKHLSWLPSCEVSEVAIGGKRLMVEVGIDHVSRGGSIRRNDQEVPNECVRENVSIGSEFSSIALFS